MLFVIFNDTAGFVKKNALNNQTNFCINLVSNSLKKKKNEVTMSSFTFNCLQSLFYSGSS